LEDPTYRFVIVMTLEWIDQLDLDTVKIVHPETQIQNDTFYIILNVGNKKHLPNVNIPYTNCIIKEVIIYGQINTWKLEYVHLNFNLHHKHLKISDGATSILSLKDLQPPT